MEVAMDGWTANSALGKRRTPLIGIDRIYGLLPDSGGVGGKV
jgi:hypothetical protein